MCLFANICFLFHYFVLLFSELVFYEMSNEKKPRLFSGKWFARLNKKEEGRRSKELIDADANLHAAQSQAKRYGELEEYVRQLRAFGRVIKAEGSPVRRSVLFAELMHFNERLPASVKLETRSLNEIRSVHGLDALPGMMADNIQSRLDTMSFKTHPREKLSRSEQALRETNLRWNTLSQHRREASRKGMKRWLRVSSLALAKKKKSLTRLFSRRTPRAH